MGCGASIVVDVASKLLQARSKSLKTSLNGQHIKEVLVAFGDLQLVVETLDHSLLVVDLGL